MPVKSIGTAVHVPEMQSGGPLFVGGSLNRPGIITNSTNPTGVPTSGVSNNFEAWIPTNSMTSATIMAEDFSSNTGSQTVNISANGAPSYDFEYDQNGNMTRMITTAADGVTTSDTVYHWDAMDRMVSVEKNGVIVSTFQYDGLGRRIFIGGKKFLWDGLKIVGIGNASLSAMTKYYDQGSTYDGNKNRYYFKDHLGSIRRVMNGANDYAAYDYDAYGNVTVASGSINVSPFLFTGHYYDAASGLYLAPFRAYDPKIGRWLSREPLGLDGPNLYHYANNDPMNQRDPLGLYSCKQWNEIKHWGIGIGAAATIGVISLACPICGLATLVGASAVTIIVYLDMFNDNGSVPGVLEMKPAFEPGFPGLSPVGPS